MLVLCCCASFHITETEMRQDRENTILKILMVFLTDVLKYAHILTNFVKILSTHIKV